MLRQKELNTVCTPSTITVDRGLRELESAALVDQHCEDYHLTLCGRILLAIYDSVPTTVERTRYAQTLLATLPPDVDFEFDLLVDAEIHLAERPDVRAPTARLAELIEEASRLKALTDAYTLPEAVHLFHRRICEAEMAAELIFREEMYRRLRDRHPARTTAVTNHERCAAYTVDGVPFGFSSSILGPSRSRGDGDSSTAIGARGAGEP